jgi:damage-control phosphatase, subfamily I
MLTDLPRNATPIEVGSRIHGAIREWTGTLDPYRRVKEEYNRKALHLYPRLKEYVAASHDRLEAALTVAAIGNVIDFGPNPDFDLEGSLQAGMASGLRGTDLPTLVERLRKVDQVLYLGDNAGEIVFDRVLVEVLVAQGAKVTFAVRGAPILNDATLADARAVGMDRVAEVVSSGMTGPGTVLAQADQAFLDLFSHAELILSKGQGNYEGLSEEEGPIFFLLMVKCPVVARDLGADAGDFVLRKAGPMGRIRSLRAPASIQRYVRR